MMGVYIKGMEMPTSCRACLYSRTDIRNVDWCVLTGKDLPCDCPLIYVPPHGRLIDADALEDYVIALKRDAIHAYEWTGKSGEWSARVSERERFAVAIEDAPTVIPPEEGE